MRCSTCWNNPPGIEDPEQSLHLKKSTRHQSRYKLYPGNSLASRTCLVEGGGKITTLCWLWWGWTDRVFSLALAAWESEEVQTSHQGKNWQYSLGISWVGLRYSRRFSHQGSVEHGARQVMLCQFSQLVWCNFPRRVIYSNSFLLNIIACNECLACMLVQEMSSYEIRTHTPPSTWFCTDLI